MDPKTSFRRRAFQTLVVKPKSKILLLQKGEAKKMRKNDKYEWRKIKGAPIDCKFLELGSRFKSFFFWGVEKPVFPCPLTPINFLRCQKF